MATKKVPVPKDEQLEKQDFPLFEALDAIDRKDYGYYDRLSPEQQKKFSPYMLLQWIVNVKSNKDIQGYYLCSTDYHANKYMLDYMIASKRNFHPKVQWLMFCAARPALGKQHRSWIPSINKDVSVLKQ